MRRWVLAGAVMAVAGAVVFVAVVRSSGDGSATLDDPKGDVFGTAPAEVVAALDLARVRVERRDGDLTLTWRLHDALDRAAIGSEPVTYQVVLIGSDGASYTVQVRAAAERAEARIIDSAARDRPFLLPAPAVGIRHIQVSVPARAVDRLGDRFGWGASASGHHSQDEAPADQSAPFPE